MAALGDKFFGQLRQHEGYHLAYDSLVVFISNGVVGLLYVATHALLGRLMSPQEDYAIFAGLLALLNVLNVPSGVISTTMARYVAEVLHRQDMATWRLLVRRGLRLTLPLALGVFVLWSLASPWFRAELKAPSVAALIMVGICAFINLFNPLLGGALQGERRFGWGAVAGIGSAFGRLVFISVMVALGLGITWLLGAVAAGFAVGVLLAWWPLRRAWQGESADADASLPPARAVQGYFWNVLCAQFALFLLVNADMILMARFLAGEELAAYGRAAMLARIVFFLPMPLAAAMFPRAVTSPHPRLILGPALFTLAIGLLAAGALTLVPGLALRLIYGGAATGPLYIELTRWYVWAAIPLALLNLLAPYLWARHATARTLWLVPVCLAYLVALFFCHQTPLQMILCVLAGGTLAVLLLGWLTWHLLRAEAATGDAPAQP
jgi:O-antigen/teichoic acid export membrane protein